jgi:protein phosphatase-4 regulatory subunit 3
MTTSGWRVKLYQLAKEGAWIDHGTGHVSCKYVQSLGGLAIVVINENDNSTLLQSRVQHEDIYERQGGRLLLSWLLTCRRALTRFLH